ncbi:MAG: DUF2461 domain-containing protein [Anaerotignum sp.]
MQQFNGFLPETIDFLWELRMNNNKEWMDENRGRYQEVLKEPFDRFGKEMAECFTAFTEEKFDWRVSRINRDVRYSKDKSPYRACRWLVLKDPSLAGTTWKTKPVFYFELMPEGYIHGMGFYQSTPAYMKAFRKKIDANPKTFLNIIQDIQKKSEFTLIGEDYKKVDASALPTEVAAWYSKKHFAVVKERGIEDCLFGGDLSEELTKQWEQLMPLYQYLQRVIVEE